MKYNPELLQIAFSKVYSEFVAPSIAFADADTGARWLGALDKARTELEENDTIEFDNGVLRFFSRTTGKQRIVTAFGCHSDTCDCKNNISYHKTVYKILAHYYELIAKRDELFIAEPLPTAEAFEAIAARREAGNAEFTAFTASLPVWVSRFDYMELYLMTDRQLEAWLVDHSPMLRMKVEGKVLRMGGVRV